MKYICIYQETKQLYAVSEWQDQAEEVAKQKFSINKDVYGKQHKTELLKSRT